MTKITNNNVINLMILADFLENLPNELFNLDSFRELPMTKQRRYSKLLCAKDEIHTCGSVGCAVGWSGVALGYDDSDFLGYSSGLQEISWTNLSERLFGDLTDSDIMKKNYYMANSNYDHDGDINDWDYLFMANNDKKKSKKATIKRIYKFVEKYYET